MLKLLMVVSTAACGHVYHIDITLDNSLPADAVVQIVKSVEEMNNMLNCEAISIVKSNGFPIKSTDDCSSMNPDHGFCFGITFDDEIFLQERTSSYRDYVYHVIFLHEIGHAFGLEHVSDIKQIMTNGLTWETENREPVIKDFQFNYYMNSLKNLGVCKKENGFIENGNGHSGMETATIAELR